MSKNLKLYSGLIALFTLGAIIGSLGTGIYIRNKVTPFYQGDPVKRRTMLLNRLVTRLDLTAEQKVEIEAIIEMTQGEVKELQQKFWPKMKTLMEKRFSLVREKLNESQQEKLDEIQRRIKQRIEAAGGFPLGP